MVRQHYEWNEDTGEDEIIPVTLADGHVWSETVMDDLENANWHDQREAFENLLHILPQIYETLEYFNYHKLSRKLQKAVDKWDGYF
jgi:hypothetical protein